MTRHLISLKILSHKVALCQVRLKLAKWFWRIICFYISSMHFRYFVNISSWQRAWSFILTNLNPLYLRMLCAKVTLLKTFFIVNEVKFYSAVVDIFIHGIIEIPSAKWHYDLEYLMSVLTSFTN